MDVERFGEIQCKRLSVVGEDGRPRISLDHTQDDDGGETSTVTVTDSDGRPRITLAVTENDIAGVGTQIAIHDHRGRLRMTAFLLDSKEGAIIGVFDEAGQAVAPAIQPCTFDGKG